MWALSLSVRAAGRRGAGRSLLSLGHTASRPLTATATATATAPPSRTATSPGAVPVVGCGSNVVDVFFKVRSMPVAGTKGYFADPTRVVEATVVGGVTLNHLAWARALGTPTGLLALQGNDEHGEAIRAKLRELGVSGQHIQAGPEYATSLSHILLDSAGERAIMMAPASTGTIDAAAMEQQFGAAVRGAAIATTEISQVPLSGVHRLLQLGTDAGALTMLDVDVPPSVAVGDAALGSLRELLDCASGCAVLKPTLDAAPELLALARTKGISCDPAGPDGVEGAELSDVAQRLLRAFPQTALVAVTDGARGCGLAARTAGGKGEGIAMTVPGFAGVAQVDATGAGDAFFGGLVAGIHRFGLPQQPSDLTRLGKIAGAAGATCCETLGALPEPAVSLARMAEFVPEAEEWAGALGGAEEAAGSAGEAPSSAVLQSLEADSATLQGLAASYANSGGNATAAIERLATALVGASRVYVTGLGKSGQVGRRLAASLASAGCTAHFVQASEWVHGDLGLLRPASRRQQDGGASGPVVVIGISHSGATAELVQLADVVATLDNTSFWSVVGNADSPMASRASASGGGVVLAPVSAPELLDKLPSRSIVAQEAVANAIVSQFVGEAGVDRARFLLNHPGGAIGASGQ